MEAVHRTPHHAITGVRETIIMITETGIDEETIQTGEVTTEIDTDTKRAVSTAPASAKRPMIALHPTGAVT